MQAIAVFALFASLAGYIIVAVFDSQHLLSTEGFFHDAGGAWRAVISLTAFSITLGTGMVYILDQAKTTGGWIFLTPAGVLVGYLAIAYFYRGLSYRAAREAPNIFFLLGEKQQDGAFELTPYARCFGLFMALTYVFVLAYELDIGTKVVLESFLAEPTVAARIGFAILIYGVVAVYTALGGLRAAVSTDIFQIGLIVLFVVALAWLLSGASTVAPPAPAAAGGQDMVLAVSSALLALIMAVTTQFYSIVNANLGSSYDVKRQFTIFAWVGVLSGGFYFLVAWMGLEFGAQVALTDFIRQFVATAEGPMAGLVCAALFAGMLAVLMSTLDNMTVAITQVVSENLFRLNPFTPAGKRKVALKRLRWAHFAISVAVLALMMVAVHYFHRPFPLLLTILFAATVLSPLTAVAVWNAAQGRGSLMHDARVRWPVCLLTIACWGWYFKMTLYNEQQASVWLHLAAFGAALLLSIVDLVSARGGAWRTARGGMNGAGALSKKVV
jgi:Na+/proline symporter